MAHYPADTFQEATEIAIEASNQLHGVINGDANAEVTIEDGSKIPSVRKALVDNMYFRSPVNWQQGNITTVFNQLYLYNNGYYYSPFATLTTPITQGETPVNDSNWVLHSVGSAIQWSYTATGGETVISPPYLFNTAAVSIDGRVQTPIKSYSINNNTIILTEQLYIGETLVVTLTPTKILQHELQQSTTGAIKFLEIQVTTPTNVFPLSEPITEAIIFINGVNQQTTAYTISGNTLSFLEALPSGTTILLLY